MTDAAQAALPPGLGLKLLVDPRLRQRGPDRGLAGVIGQSQAVRHMDAVLISHGHPDHCADLNPFLRARALGEARPTALAGTRAARDRRANVGTDRNYASSATAGASHSSSPGENESRRLRSLPCE